MEVNLEEIRALRKNGRGSPTPRSNSLVAGGVRRGEWQGWGSRTEQPSFGGSNAQETNLISAPIMLSSHRKVEIAMFAPPGISTWPDVPDRQCLRWKGKTCREQRNGDVGLTS